MVKEAEPERVIRGQKGLKTTVKCGLSEEDVIMTIESVERVACKVARWQNLIPSLSLD